MKTEAERLYNDRSYSKAYEIYLKADALDLIPAEARWVDFRLADTLWRSESATKSSDPTNYQRARDQLDVLVRDIKRTEDRDLVWAEVQESFGDFWWNRNESRNWGQAQAHYTLALDWWAGSSNIELARSRYLSIIWKASKPSWSEPYQYYGYYGNILSPEVLENAIRIAGTENDKAHAHYLMAMTLRYHGSNWNRQQRLAEEFEAAISGGSSTDWYDDALYYYAEWLANSDRLVRFVNGKQTQEYNYVKALELYRLLVSRRQKGESRYYDQAKQQIEQITKPFIGLGVSYAFLPDSEIQIELNWRNVKQIDLAIYKVDITKDVHFPTGESDGAQWLQRISLSGRQPTRTLSKQTADKGDHVPGHETVRIEGKLPLGAYIVEATAGALNTRDLLLVSDASLVVKTSRRQALVYFCNAIDGSPLPNSAVKLWERVYNGTSWSWHQLSKQTGGDGLAVFELTQSQYQSELFACASSDDRQALSYAYAQVSSRDNQPWKIYVVTDRPAYRPGETAHWKLTARKYDGSDYSTPSGQTVVYQIQDPKGSKIAEGNAVLNDFGSAWGSVELTASMPLGEYRVSFWDNGKTRSVGTSAMFRLEEYKLPEFKVTVRTPEEDGKPKSFRLGDKISADIQADYYFGGAVSNATVEVVVHQSPFYHWWYPRHEYEWYYEDLIPRNYHGGRNGQIIKRDVLKTDATGKAHLEFDTQQYAGQDTEFYIEARVTDSSRREIIGSNTIRVTRQRYYVYAYSKHYLHRPGNKVTFDIKSLDANQQPVSVEGAVKITRNYWYEVWLDPSGNEIKGDELIRLKRAQPGFPPPARDGKAWRLKSSGYQQEEILTQTVKTNAEGEAEVSFTPDRIGYFQMSWTSQDKGGPPITAAASVWVSTESSTDLGYRHGGIQIIVDRDTFRAGQKAPVMLVTPANNRYVLFSLEGDDLYDYRVVHLDGTTKLVELQIEDKHIPNIFLSATMISGGQMFMDNRQVIVPPADHFLTVDVKPDRDQYEPRDAGTLSITTRDNQGRPVSAEVALALTDESVFYIQGEYAADPRRFYYGSKRPLSVHTSSTFQYKRYASLDDTTNKRSGLQSIREEGAFSDAVATNIGGRDGQFREADRMQVSKSAERKDEGLPIDGRVALNAMAISPGVVAQAGQKQGEQAVQVRSDFRSTAFWQPDVITDKNGKATVRLQYPESLTTWRASARVVTQTNQFGVATASTRTKQPLIVRLQAPRFFLVGDRLTVSAVLNNNTDGPLTVSTSLAADGVTVSGLIEDGKPVKGELASVTVKPESETRVDWLVVVSKPGAARLKVTARGGKFSDAMEKEFVVHEHGLEKYVARSGKLSSDEVTVRLNIPKERKPESTSMAVQVAPSMAVTMLDALPYLVDYPYGCTEQTMSRFLPAAITAKTLRDLGLKPEDVMGRLFGGVEQNTASQSHPRGKKDLRKLDDMVKAGLDRLYGFQHSDGGWGWWQEGESDHFMTAYVVWGLSLSRTAGIELKNGVLERGVAFLEKEIVEEENNYDSQAWMLHSLASYHSIARAGQVRQFESKAFENLWTNRDRLNAYTRALLALSAHYYGFSQQAQVLVQNLENGVKIDSEPDNSVIQSGGTRSTTTTVATAHWGEDGLYWRWSDGGVEATSFALRALLAIEPGNKLVEPVTNWLIKNRRGAQWSNTRDTAITVLVLNDYLRVSGEASAAVEYQVIVNGSTVANKKLSAADALAGPSTYNIEPGLIDNGTNEVRIKRVAGNGPLYFAAYAQFFSLEEPLTAAGNQMFVRRDYYKLVGKPTLLKGYVYDSQPLRDGDTVASGERVEVVLTVETKNNYEYLVFEDLKPAGFEAVQIRSGEPLYAQEIKTGALARRFPAPAGPESDPPANIANNVSTPAGSTGRQVAPAAYSKAQGNYTGRNRWVYQELRDRKVALFLDRLPQGIWEIRYTLRAETPGRFHALPVIGHAMYVPEIRCNSVEERITIEDRR